MRYQSALTLFAVFTVYAIGANATNKSDIQELKQRMQELEERGGCCAEQGCATCNADPEGLTPFYLWGEGIYWKAAEGGLPMTNVFISNDAGTDTTGKIKHVPFDWHWGFRVGAGYNMCHDLWNIYATWTRYHFSDSKTSTLGPDRDPDIAGFPTLSAFWIPGAGVGPYNSITSQWRVHFDQADLQLSREFYVTNSLSLTPHLGLRTAWIRQKFAFDAVIVGADASSRNFDVKSNFWGFGIVGGLDTKWNFGCGFSMYGGVALSILDGHFESPLEFESFDSGILVSVLNNTSHQNMAVLFTDLAIGLRYDTDFCCERFRWALWAGYEQHIYFEQNQFQNIQYSTEILSYTDGSNLSTNGITVGMEFGF